MTRQFSFYGLLATVIAIGVLFYRVIEPFVFALLFALVLSVLLRPVHNRLTEMLRGRRRIAAGVITGGFGISVIVPLAVVMVLAGMEIQRFVRDQIALQKPPASATEQARPGNGTPSADPWPATAAKSVANSDPASPPMEEAPNGWDGPQWISRTYAEMELAQRKQLVDNFSAAILRFVDDLYQNTVSAISSVVGFFIGVVVITMALYYLLADGASILEEAKQLLPFEEHEVQELADQFGKICRGIVLGTVVASLVQAVLALLGFVVAGVPNLLPLFVMTIIFAFIPLVGAGTAVTLVCLWLAWEGHYLAGGLLFAYGAGVVSTSDNLIRAYVIGSEAKMNPLLVLITVIGAIQLIGLWGIFAGPMIAAFFYTTMKLLRQRISDPASLPSHQGSAPSEMAIQSPPT